MGLRQNARDDDEYADCVKKIQKQLMANCATPVKNLGIQNWQNIILDNKNRLFHWVKNRHIPPDNNQAERELRPTVIATKNSFGSQSEAGAETRSVLMSILHTAAKRLENQTLRQWLLQKLDDLAQARAIDFLQFLPPIPPD